jgi:hypothetical protein
VSLKKEKKGGGLCGLCSFHNLFVWSVKKEGNRRIYYHSDKREESVRERVHTQGKPKKKKKNSQR